jgi:hypothetical protein
MDDVPFRTDGTVRYACTHTYSRVHSRVICFQKPWITGLRAPILVKPSAWFSHDFLRTRSRSTYCPVVLRKCIIHRLMRNKTWRCTMLLRTYICNGPEGILVGRCMGGTTLQSSSESIPWSWRLMASSR